MQSPEIAKKLIQHIGTNSKMLSEDCTQTENKGNVCSCVANQVSGLLALETIPETKELYHREIYPMSHALLANIGFLCDRRKVGSIGEIHTKNI